MMPCVRHTLSADCVHVHCSRNKQEARCSCTQTKWGSWVMEISLREDIVNLKPATPTMHPPLPGMPFLTPSKHWCISHLSNAAFPQCKFRVYSAPSHHRMIKTISISFKCFIGQKDGCFYEPNLFCNGEPLMTQH